MTNSRKHPAVPAIPSVVRATAHRPDVPDVAWLKGHIESLMTMYHECAHAGPLHGCREVACVESRRIINRAAADKPTEPARDAEPGNTLPADPFIPGRHYW